MKDTTVKFVNALCLTGSVVILSIVIAMVIAPKCSAQTYEGSHPPTNYGGRYWGLPDTIGQTMDQEIMIQTQQMEADMLNQPLLSYEEYQYQKDVEICEGLKFGFAPFTLGLSILWNCYE